MQPQDQERQLTPKSASFAGLLAALTAPKVQASSKADDSWVDNLGDDVATLSYERAIENHARYKSLDSDAVPFNSISGTYAPRLAPESRSIQGRAPEGANWGAVSESGLNPSTEGMVPSVAEQRKCASVTVRMSEREHQQLQQRAAEAGVTLSAYLRSCTFEAESLRTQVKQALAELRTAPHTQTGTGNSHASGMRWLRFFRPRQ